MLGIPEDKNVAKVLRWADEHNLFTITLCHGPGALLSTILNDQEFLYKGYNMAVFPDAVDNAGYPFLKTTILFLITRELILNI
jgi:molecular chaperone Hsp31 and glyoxalase 3